MSLRNFEVLDRIGEGAYSTVLKVRRFSDNQIYALKKVRMNNLKDKEKRNSLNEVRILASITNPHVVSYKEAFFDEDSNCLCIVMEYASAGDLYQKIQLHQKLRQYMPEGFLVNVLISVTQALKSLHDLNIMHRDIKSANVFLFSNSQVKLGDMNVSKVAGDDLNHTQTGTPYYASPEIWKDAPYGIKSDIWSFGCVLYEAASLRPPFKADDMKGLYKKVVKGDYSPLPRVFSKEFQSVISQMLQVDPNKRPACEDILRMNIVSKMLVNEIPQPDPLMDTIIFPKNFTSITEQLPKAKYNVQHGARKNQSEFRNSKRNTRGNSEKVGQSMSPISHKLIMRENYGAFRLPKIKYPSRSPFKPQVSSKNRLHLGHLEVVHRSKKVLFG